MYLNFYSDSEYRNLVGQSNITLSGETPASWSISLPGAGTYYAQATGLLVTKNIGQIVVPEGGKTDFALTVAFSTASGTITLNQGGTLPPTLTVQASNADISNINLGTISITTKTINGTLKDGLSPVSNGSIYLFDHAVTIADIIADNIWDSSYGSGSTNENGEWSFNVLNSVTEGYFLIIKSDRACYPPYIQVNSCLL